MAEDFTILEATEYLESFGFQVIGSRNSWEFKETAFSDGSGICIYLEQYLGWDTLQFRQLINRVGVSALLVGSTRSLQVLEELYEDRFSGLCYSAESHGTEWAMRRQFHPMHGLEALGRLILLMRQFARPSTVEVWSSIEKAFIPFLTGNN